MTDGAPGAIHLLTYHFIALEMSLRSHARTVTFIDMQERIRHQIGGAMRLLMAGSNAVQRARQNQAMHASCRSRGN